MNYLIKSLLALGLVILGSIKFLPMYEVLAGQRTRFSPDLLKKIHRFSGVLFIVLFLYLSYLCKVGLTNNPYDFSPRAIVHTVIAVTIAILIAIKLLSIKFYRGFYSDAVAFGKAGFILMLVLFAISGGYYFLLLFPKDNTGAFLVQNRCVRCHNLERVYGAKRPAQDWLVIVKRMSDRVPGWISVAEAGKITDYLVKTRGN